MNYITAFKKSVSENADKPALVDFDGTRQTTYRELDRLSSCVAGKLHALGCHRGDFAAVLMGRRMEYLAAYLGILKAGCAVVPLIPEIPPERISYITKHCDAKLIIGIDFFADVETYESFEGLAGDDDPALLIYTSGSTGTPKGILHTVSSLTCALMYKSPFSRSEEGRLNYAAAAPFSFIAHADEYLFLFLQGAAVHIMSDTVLHSIDLLQQYYESQSIVNGMLPGQIVRYLIHPPKSLKKVVVTGERFLNVPAPETYNIVYIYGQAETCGGVTCFFINKEYRTPPVGKTADEREIVILDENGTSVPQGLDGEICVLGNSGVSYFKDPELSAKTFVRTEDGRCLIHTGDIGFIDENGDLNYVTRKDWMVKINGQRVETSEVEASLLSIPSVKEAAVKAFTDENAQTYLVGYYVSDAGISQETIRSSLAEKLPSYMIPRYLVKLDALPKNMNGKTDREALPAPAFDTHHSADGKEIVLPRSETERKIYDIVSKIIGHTGFGITANLYNAGLDSLGSIALLTRIEEEFHVPLQMNTIYTCSTIENLAAWIEEAKPAGVFEIQADYPITKTQESTYYLSEDNPRYYPSIVYTLLRLQDGTDIRKFISAVETAIDAHPYLKTTLRKSKEGLIRAVRNDHLKADVSVITCDKLHAHESLPRHHELLHSPLYRAELYKTSSGNYFYIDFHHIISDGITLLLILRDICKIYLGQEPEKELCDGFTAGLLEEGKRHSDEFIEAKTYYAHLLKGCEPTEIPCRTEMSVPKMFSVQIACSSPDEDISRYCHEHGCTKNAFFNAVFTYLLSTYDEKKDVHFASLYSGRTDSRLLNTFSLISTSIPVRHSVSKSKIVDEMISDIQYQMYESMSNDAYSPMDIAAEYGYDYRIWFVNESENLKYVADLTGSEALLSDIMQVFDISSFVMDVVIPKDREFTGENSNKSSHIIFLLSPAMNGRYVLSIMGDGGRYSESFLEEMLLRYDKILREFLIKEYVSEISL